MSLEQVDAVVANPFELRLESRDDARELQFHRRCGKIVRDLMARRATKIRITMTSRFLESVVQQRVVQPLRQSHALELLGAEAFVPLDYAGKLPLKLERREWNLEAFD